MADLLAQLTTIIDRLVEADPASVADGDTLVRLHAQLERLTAVQTRAVGRFDTGGQWAADGARTASAWLSTRCHTPKRAAQRRVGLARILRRMPAAEAAWLTGRIGEAQVVTLREALEVEADLYARDETMLVDQAATLQHRHLQRAVAYWCQLAEPDDIEQLAQRDRDNRRAHLSPGMRGTGTRLSDCVR